MSKNLIWKFAVIFGLIALFSWEVWPPERKLKPGIDLAGGTSLLYQIDTTGLTDREKRTIATDMIRILQQRIDPGSKRNLVWRPHGSDRIEIQMPLAKKDSQQKRRLYRDKLSELERFNINTRLVRQGLVQPTGMADDEYKKLRSSVFERQAQGSDERMELLELLGEANDNLISSEKQLVETLKKENELRDGLEKAKLEIDQTEGLVRQWNSLSDPCQTAAIVSVAGEDAKKQSVLRSYVKAKLELAKRRENRQKADEGLGAAWANLGTDNIETSWLEDVLGSNDRDKQIEQLKQKHPSRITAIDELVAAYELWEKVAGRLDDPEDLKRLLRGAGVLEFRILPLSQSGELSEADTQRYHDLIAKYGPNPKKSGDKNYAWRKVKDPEGFERNDAILDKFAGNTYVLASNTPNETLLHERGEDAWRLVNARPDSDQLGNFAVAFSMNEIGAGRFFELTRENLERPMAILLDDEIISAPTIRAAIRRHGQITGRFSQQEVLDLVDKLNAGSLPARLGDQPISVNAVSSTIGHDNLVAGLKAGMYGLIAVAVFMLVYYWVAGALANIALFMNLLLIIGIMAFSRATFTMPGIAALILTIGMAVDANVLIFERIREEQLRGGSIRMAIKNGYGRAFRTILDANVTTFITALILWLRASEEVKGFALTLMIGIVCSMFTALFVTRTIFDFMIDKRWLKNKLKMLHIISIPKIHWMGARPFFWAISLVFVIGGWTIFLGRDELKNSKYSIEFTGGTSIHVVLNDAGADMDRAAVEKAVGDIGLAMGNPQIAAARVQRIGPQERREFEITTTETNRLEVAISVIGRDDLTADNIQSAVRTAAQAAGDGRTTKAIVKQTNEKNKFILETEQANRNKVYQVLNRATAQLSGVSYGKITETETGGVSVTIKSTSNAIDAEAISNAISRSAEVLGYSTFDNPTIKAGEGNGEFILNTNESAEPKQTRQVLDRAIIDLSKLDYGQAVTRELVNNAVRDALEGKLDVLSNLEPKNVISKPITRELISEKPYLNEFLGGLYLSCQFGEGNIETFERINQRFDQLRFKSEFEEQYGHNPFELFAAGGLASDETPISTVEMAVVSADVVYDGTESQQWNEFVGLQTERFTEGLRWQTSLPRITQIDASVGQKSMNAAMVAIVFSLLAIIIYIWVRFGTFRFGLAAVMAIFHDISIAVGVVAASAWLSTTSIGEVLLISDFKIDLPMIAAFLTVIGYSLNDTIVVFDRIRENRGKLATLSPDIINHSINQTLSRTILTSTTTLMVLIIMYVLGGEGLRGFNYVLIVGVLVGTYSSIGIATPLLYGAKASPIKKATNKNSSNRRGNAKA